MKNRKKIWLIGAGILAVAILSIVIVKYLKDPTRLSVEEKSWVNKNINNAVNIMVLNDDEVFGNAGNGVFYHLIEDFSKEYDIEINPVTYTTKDTPKGIYLGKSNTYKSNDTIIYKDHYVLVSKNYELIKSIDSLNGKLVGISNRNLSYVSSYLKDVSIDYKTYNKADLLKALNNDEISYAIVPLNESIHYLLTNNINVIYHFGDINYYYLLKSDDSIFANVLKKYFISWEDSLEKYRNEVLLNIFMTDLKISATELQAAKDVEYNYGFINNSPYEIIMGGNYGGIIASYLQKFTDFSGISFNFNRYKTFDKFLSGIETDKIILYFNHYNYVSGFSDIKLSMPINYDIILSKDDTTVISSLASLQGKEVYVEENSMLQAVINGVPNVRIKTYKSNNDMFKLVKKGAIILVDHNIYDYYKATELKNYSSRYNDLYNSEYTLKIRDNTILSTLLSKYVMLLDSKEMITIGILNHYETVKAGTVMGTIAKYILYVLLIAAIVGIFVYRKAKKITVIKRIKKEDKLKYIDQLTSLKNRNYLSENIEAWNNNNVYPQAVIVIDLNNVQYINDTLGYDEGDKQIKALANSLIKTQLDYTDIIRTDGNEFLVYMIGYSQKQVANYINKLSKEFKRLPYDFGAEFGYSMILDDIKTIEDAMNEAVEEMKKQKKEKSEHEKEEK